MNVIPFPDKQNVEERKKLKQTKTRENSFILDAYKYLKKMSANYEKTPSHVNALNK